MVMYTNRPYLPRSREGRGIIAENRGARCNTSAHMFHDGNMCNDYFCDKGHLPKGKPIVHWQYCCRNKSRKHKKNLHKVGAWQAERIFPGRSFQENSRQWRNKQGKCFQRKRERQEGIGTVPMPKNNRIYPFWKFLFACVFSFSLWQMIFVEMPIEFLTKQEARQWN